MKIGLALQRSAYSGSRFFIRPMNSWIFSSAPGGRSWATPPGRMKPWFIRRPVISSKRSRHELALAEADRHDRQRADLHAAGSDRHQVRRDPVELHEQDPHQAGLLRDVGLDVEQPLHAHAVGGLVVERRQVVHPGAERHALHPGAVLHVLLDARVQVADAATALGDRLAVELEDEPQHAVRRRVLGAHVDDDALLGLGVDPGDDGVPVLPGDGEDLAARRAPGRSRTGRCAWLSLLGISCRPFARRAAGSWRPCTRRGCHRAGSPCAAGGRASRRASGSGSTPGGRRR